MKIFEKIRGIFAPSVQAAVIKAIDGTPVERHGAIKAMWGMPGSTRAMVIRHDFLSQKRAEEEAECIRKNGEIPKTEITYELDTSNYANAGFFVKKYTWRTVVDKTSNAVSEAPPKTFTSTKSM